MITSKEKGLRAREEEVRRNLQELGEDVAAITGLGPVAKDYEISAPVPATATAAATTTSTATVAESVSPQQRIPGLLFSTEEILHSVPYVNMEEIMVGLQLRKVRVQFLTVFHLNRKSSNTAMT